MTFVTELTKWSKPIWNAIFSHPFIEELGAGTLSKERFFYYLKQDWIYVQEFVRALCIVATKAPTIEYLKEFTNHALFTIEAEHSMQLKLTQEEGILKKALEKTSRAPITQAYIDHLISGTRDGTFGEGVATVLPCTWIYSLVGKRLSQKTPSDPFYSEWIKTYDSSAIETNLKKELEIMNEVARSSNKMERTKMKEKYFTSTRYEYMFWDQAYHLITWEI